LDGEHTYEATKQAFEMYEPLVMPGGYIILHDAWPWPENFNNPFPGVTQVAQELLLDKRFKHN
jgi:cephalosporin hydroxylase